MTLLTWFFMTTHQNQGNILLFVGIKSTLISLFVHSDEIIMSLMYLFFAPSLFSAPFIRSFLFLSKFLHFD